MIVANNLQKAAFNYAKCAKDLCWILSKDLPGAYAEAFRETLLDARSQLELAAHAYFDDVYSGKEE